MIQGALFTSDFLTEGVNESEFWKGVDKEELESFKEKLKEIFNAFPTTGHPNESTTERDLIDPVIEALGWQDYLTQQTASKKGRSDIPDYLLFADNECKQKASSESSRAEGYKHGLAILEAKAWMIPLDRKKSDLPADGVPSNQILRYLNRVEVQTNGKIKWGILTNGREWRLYYQKAKSRSEEFLSLDLPVILGLEEAGPDLFDYGDKDKQDWLKVFYVFFRKPAFIESGLENLTFHERALKEGRYWEEKAASDLSEVVFNEVFPKLAQSLAENDPQKPESLDPVYLSELRQATLILLYRLLFLLYAEDRNLLPVSDSKYDDYGLRKRVRDDVKNRIDEQDVFSAAVAHYYKHVIDLCSAVDKGDSSIGLPPYNGGLFDPGRAPLLERSKSPDADFAPLFDKLSRLYEGDSRKWINYRDLSVQQLGSIYERFLEFELVPGGEGGIEVYPNIFARKTTGSYYTPESLVNLIINKSVGPLIDEKMEEFQAKAAELQKKRTAKAERLKELAKLDPASNVLDLRVCDPAMGSGHFLVSLVDYLADRILILADEARTMVEWADEEHPYLSPLAENIRVIREHILEEAKAHNFRAGRAASKFIRTSSPARPPEAITPPNRWSISSSTNRWGR